MNWLFLFHNYCFRIYFLKTLHFVCSNPKTHFTTYLLTLHISGIFFLYFQYFATIIFDCYLPTVAFYHFYNSLQTYPFFLYFFVFFYSFSFFYYFSFIFWLIFFQFIFSSFFFSFCLSFTRSFHVYLENI